MLQQFRRLPNWDRRVRKVSDIPRDDGVHGRRHGGGNHDVVLKSLPGIRVEQDKH
jgi:hypothetical protein